MEYKTELNDLINIVVKEGASDIHLSEGRHPTIRVSGTLIPLLKKAVLTKEHTAGLLKELLTPANRELFMNTREID